MLSTEGAPGGDASEAEDAGHRLFAAYEDAWRRLGNASKVVKALALEPWEHLELAAWGLPGARRVAEARAARLEPRS